MLSKEKGMFIVFLVCILFIVPTSLAVTKTEFKEVIKSSLIDYFSCKVKVCAENEVLSKEEIKDLLLFYFGKFREEELSNSVLENTTGTNSQKQISSIYNGVLGVTTGLSCGSVGFGECSDKGEYCFDGVLSLDEKCDSAITCENKNGKICLETEVCFGNQLIAPDTDSCCDGECIPTCSEQGGIICDEGCDGNIIFASDTHNTDQYCCVGNCTIETCGLLSTGDYTTDDFRCGTISCSGYYVQEGKEGSTTTEECYNKYDIKTNRCEGPGNCKDENSEDCDTQENKDLIYSCGKCKYIDDQTDCTNDIKGACTDYPEGTDTGICRACTGSGGEEKVPDFDIDCGDEGIIDCSRWYVQQGSESATETEHCYNKKDIDDINCEGLDDCKDANTADCDSQEIDSIKYSCGRCKYIPDGSCNGNILGGCLDYEYGYNTDVCSICAGINPEIEELSWQADIYWDEFEVTISEEEDSFFSELLELFFGEFDEEGNSTIIECSDSDDGLDYYTKGQIDFKELDTNSNILATSTPSDQCVQVYNSSEIYLREYYCEQDNTVQYEHHLCENGCEEGACIETPEEERCSDSDSGENIFEKGTTKGYNVYGGDSSSIEEYVDTCDGEERLMEFYCETQNDPHNGLGYVSMNNVLCENGCENGACVKDPNACVLIFGTDDCSTTWFDWTNTGLITDGRELVNCRYRSNDSLFNIDINKSVMCRGNEECYSLCSADGCLPVYENNGQYYLNDATCTETVSSTDIEVIVPEEPTTDDTCTLVSGTEDCSTSKFDWTNNRDHDGYTELVDCVYKATDNSYSFFTGQSVRCRGNEMCYSSCSTIGCLPVYENNGQYYLNDATCNGIIEEEICAEGTDTGICKECDGVGGEQMPIDDSDCGTIDCDGLNYYYDSGSDSATSTNYCILRDYNDITASRCEALGDCKDANSDDCIAYNDFIIATCGTCQYCSGSSCSNYGSGTSCADFTAEGVTCDGSGACDYDSYTVLMLHMEDSSLSDSAGGHSTTEVGQVAWSSSAEKFGTYGATFDGSGDYISITDSSDWTFGSDDFTIDLWAYLIDGVANRNFFQQGTAVGGTASFNFYYNANKLYFDYSKTSSSWSGSLSVSWTPTYNQFHHIAVVRSGTNLYFFVDGTQIGSTQTISDTFYDSNADVKVGNSFYGYIDELRISKGIARWTTDFTPPSLPYTP